MFIPQLSCCCLALVFAMAVQADAYKWIDDDGDVIYSQTPPVDKPYEKMGTPPPPSMNPEAAKKQVESLIEAQKATDKAREEEQQKQQQEQLAAEALAENCRVAKYNLQQYQNNPGRRMMDAQGNVTRPTEEERQQKISTLQQQVNQFCE
ncbi:MULTISPECIES: DUF4124 domain-containing protein [unclassified Methylophaga]|jgi:hypothetical protein|uniref:DUF4124 domain-containing protein n=1 Tax=unclassified Methylophaga TaxID=2629249 RepID=UPI000C979409|nr:MULTISPECIES: DUF4124 domain-containing protein [unclassified Methylophaga]MAK66574.1 energy transducer TonB [Methylophaga sp.]MAY17547.1 energy transducer TonB [Methylophaga sp.]MBN47490.1 energy transducer TonB [Methylophaga sp.]HAO24154.1 DUF4124 domain-containing protein [Methylophaga sp.]|tara:strand:- start:37589 stop:38038 length:450 start_codon:yes stop_codon:yes gene_type:complete